MRDAIVSTFVTHVTKTVLGRQTPSSATARVLQVARVSSESRAGKPAMAQGSWCPGLQRPREGGHIHGNCGEGQGPQVAPLAFREEDPRSRLSGGQLQGIDS